MNNAQKGDKILEYDNEQTTEINANNIKIETVEQSVTDLSTLVGSIGTGIIDTGTANDATYIKFESGLLLNFGYDTLQGNNENNPKRINYGLRYKEKPNVYTQVTRAANTIGTSPVVVINTSTSNVNYFNVFHSSTVAINIGIFWFAIGFWK